MLTRASDTIENIERLRTVVEEVPCEEVLGVVVYDLPGRDCAAKASNGELKVGEIEKYKTEFIDRESSPVSLFSAVLSEMRVLSNQASVDELLFHPHYNVTPFLLHHNKDHKPEDSIAEH